MKKLFIIVSLILVGIVLLLLATDEDSTPSYKTKEEIGAPIDKTPTFLGDTIVFWTDEHGNFILKIQGQDGEWRLVEPLEKF